MKHARERLLLAIEAWGPMAVFDHRGLVRWLKRNEPESLPLVKQALMEGGMNRVDVEDLFHKRHPADCACWRCIMRLQMKVAQELSAREFANHARTMAEGDSRVPVADDTAPTVRRHGRALPRPDPGRHVHPGSAHQFKGGCHEGVGDGVGARDSAADRRHRVSDQRSGSSGTSVPELQEPGPV